MIIFFIIIIGEFARSCSAKHEAQMTPSVAEGAKMGFSRSVIDAESCWKFADQIAALGKCRDDLRGELHAGAAKRKRARDFV